MDSFVYANIALPALYTAVGVGYLTLRTFNYRLPLACGTFLVFLHALFLVYTWIWPLTIVAISLAGFYLPVDIVILGFQRVTGARTIPMFVLLSHLFVLGVFFMVATSGLEQATQKFATIFGEHQTQGKVFSLTSAMIGFSDYSKEFERSTFVVRNNSETPRFPNGDYSPYCCRPLPPSPLVPWDNKLRLNLMLDTNRLAEEVRLPVVVHIHGGGWVNGVKADERYFFLTHLVKRCCALVSLDYRLMSYGYTFEDQVSDIEASLRWIMEKGHLHGLDPTRIILVGESAGAHLATISAFRLKEESQGAIRGVVNACGFLEPYLDNFPSMWIYPILEPYVRNWRNDLTIEERLRQIGASNFLNASTALPVVSVHGALDQLTPLNNAEELHEKLDSLGVRNLLVTLRRGTHCDIIVLQAWMHFMELMTKALF